MTTPMIVDVIEGHEFPRTEFVNCPLCGELRRPRQIAVQFEMIASVAECNRCRIAFQTPRPTLEASLHYMNWRWSSSDAYVADNKKQLSRARQQLQYVESVAYAPGTLLDFGAGAGAFVKVARDAGWQANGVERSDAARSRARTKYDVELLSELDNQQYDVITMWDVVEHLREPVKTLNMLYNNIKAGGLLFIETGNYESWMRLSHKKHWGLYLFDHHFYFSPKSLENMLGKSGFSEFRLLNVNHTGSPQLQKGIQNPRMAIKEYFYWIVSKWYWPQHGDINIMIASARRL